MDIIKSERSILIYIDCSDYSTATILWAYSHEFCSHESLMEMQVSDKFGNQYNLQLISHSLN